MLWPPSTAARSDRAYTTSRVESYAGQQPLAYLARYTPLSARRSLDGVFTGSMLGASMAEPRRVPGLRTLIAPERAVLKGMTNFKSTCPHCSYSMVKFAPHAKESETHDAVEKEMLEHLRTVHHWLE